MARRQVIEPSAAALSEELAEAIASFRFDPLGFVLFAFPWGEPESKLSKEDGPDEWQVDILQTLGLELMKRDGDAAAALGAIQIAIASGHGVGKTALVSWIIIWFTSTREDPQIITTANTQGQLTGKTWRELAKWHRMAINADWFTWTATTFYYKPRPETHKAVAVPWTKERSEAFAGTHEKHVLMIFDEASSIDDSIWTAADGAMTTTGAIFLVFGNPTRTNGRFRECFRQFRHRWIVRQIDSRGCKMANRAQIDAWIADYGEDSDFVRIRVKGQFPRAGSKQLVGSDLVYEAQQRFRARHGDQVKRLLQSGAEGLRDYVLDENRWAARIFVVDVARFGGDQIVMGMRQANCFVSLYKSREMSVPQIADQAHHLIEMVMPDHIIVDSAGVGGGVVDLLREMGHEIVAALGGAKPINPRKYFNRRTEMWLKLKDWLDKAGMIEHYDQELADDLTGPEYGFADRGDRIQIETKEDMQSRGLPSPDTGDALAMSFWQEFAPVDREDERTVKDKILRMSDGMGSGETWKARAF